MVSVSVLSLSQDAVRKSFRVCGIAADGVHVPESELHSRLQNILEKRQALEGVDGGEESGDSAESDFDFIESGAHELSDCSEDEL